MGGVFKRPMAMRMLQALLNALLPEGINREKALTTFEAILYHIAYCIDARTIEFGSSILTIDELYAFLRTFPSLSSVHLHGRAQVVKSTSSSTSLLPIQGLHMHTYFYLASNVFDVINPSKLRSFSLTPTYSSRLDVPYLEGLKAIVEGSRSQLRELCISLTNLQSGEVTQFCSDIRFKLFPKLTTLTLTIDTRNMDNFGKLDIMLRSLTTLDLHVRTLELRLTLFSFVFQATGLESIADVQAQVRYPTKTRQWDTFFTVLEDTGIFHNASNVEKLIVSIELLVAPVFRGKDKELLRDSVVESIYLSLPKELRGRPNFEYSWKFTYYDLDPFFPDIPDLMLDD
ncbi:hypothetical protein GYMLUDRAFT_997635 [Collybiopsis luxurians FD-317 M1]|uniref:Uncharacterized protein n=1 Tax=Collybiopsis luxurians FD-317 M1 TaxID=944289 RepID=A0A0D0CXU1_9AGAR|nr:hypothetical protein GYMLUDRAFT_997635 [Collybiopsis luxurians FD-317 M1]